MILYLAQHGDALPHEQDVDRPLSAGGRSDIEAAGRLLGRTENSIGAIAHSGKLRARQTAELLATYLAPCMALQTNASIKPMDLPTVVAEEIDQLQDDILLVGHLPHLAKLVTLLLTGHEEPAIVSFSPGTIACLERADDKTWSLKWLISPDMIVGSA